MIDRIKTFLRDQDGLTIVEYAVAAGMITLLVVGAFTILGGNVDLVIRAVAGFITVP